MTVRQTIKKPTHIRHSKIHDLARSIRLVNFETGEVATIMPNLGATVLDLVLKSGTTLHTILESPGTLREIIDNKHYHGVKLIPFPGRIPNGTYQFAGKQYTLKRNSKADTSSLHGFVCKKPFRIVRTSVNNRRAFVILEYIHTGDTKGYPFKFSVRLTYTLANSSFSCTTVVRNKDRRSIPMGDGWHPYFKTSGKTNRLLISLPSHSVVDLTPQKVPTGRSAKPTRRTSIIPLKRKAIDSVFDLGEKRRRATTKLINPKTGVALNLWQEAGKGKYRYLIVYRPPSGTSVAIEPWTCAPNAANNNMGLIVLKPGGIFKASYGVSLKSVR
jgi:aldose 1-epimerase